jgi:galactokinase
MDQAISLRATPGRALLYGDDGATARQIPLELGAAGLCLVVIDTRAEHSLADGQYADRRATCRRASERLGVARLADVEDLDAALRALTDPVERRRVRHVVTEIARVHRFVELVSASNISASGPLMDESHESLRSDYEVSCHELDVAVTAARAAGAVGARMTGGGFGGSAIALTAIDSVDQVIETVAEAYVVAGLRDPQFLVVDEAASAGRRIQ